MVVRRWVAGLVWVPLVLGAVGCSDSSGYPSAESAGEAPSSSSGTPSESASPSSGPSVPPEAMGADEASAKAFVRYWFEVLSEAMVSGDTGPVRELSSSRCESCTALLENFDEVYEAGGYFETEGWVVLRVLPGPTHPDGVADYFLRTREEERALYNRRDRLVDRRKATLTGMRVLLASKASVWKVRELEVIR